MLAAFVAAFTVALGAAGLVWAVRVRDVIWDVPAAPWPAAHPVLGGSEPPTHAWNRVHARWYPMSLVLVAFEMEMMVMYPWAVVYVEVGIAALVEMGVFLSLLGLGLAYAWREGVFSWQ